VAKLNDETGGEIFAFYDVLSQDGKDLSQGLRIENNALRARITFLTLCNNSFSETSTQVYGETTR
jgi:hypothetical protein